VYSLGQPDFSPQKNTLLFHLFGIKRRIWKDKTMQKKLAINDLNMMKNTFFETSRYVLTVGPIS
jgi:hypothetical protein